MSGSTVTKMFIYCDAHGRRSPVATFTRTGATNNRGGWTEIQVRGREAGVTLADDKPLTRPVPIDQADLDGREVRSAYRLTCPRCPRTGRLGVASEVSVREETLFRVLDGFAENGMSDVTLALVAASLGRSPNE